ncbi:MAG: hypothetical protein AB7E32_07325 [Desulfovibrio sp.]
MPAAPAPSALPEIASAIRQALLRHYLFLVAPAAFVMGLWAALKALDVVGPLQGLPVAVLGPATFILAVVLALAAPRLLRARFVNSVAGERGVEDGPFLAFEKLLLTASLPATWAAAAAYVLEVNLFHFAGALLAALYAAYYYYPSPERVAHEMRLFRVGRIATGTDSAGGAA